MLLRMRSVVVTALALAGGYLSAVFCLILVTLAGGVGPIELVVFGIPAFALGYWLTRRRLAGG